MTTHDALAVPAPGWSPLPALAELAGTRSFVSGDPAGERLRVAWFARDDGALVGRVWFGPLAEGPPGHAHGGAMAAVLDEAMGLCCWLHGHRVLARELNVTFKRPLPLGRVAVVACHLGEARERRWTTTGTLRLASDGGDDGGDVCAEAHGSFTELPAERFARLFAGKAPTGG